MGGVRFYSRSLCCLSSHRIASHHLLDGARGRYRSTDADVPAAGDPPPEGTLVGPHDGSQLVAFPQKKERWHRPDSQNGLDGRGLVDVDLQKDNVRIVPGEGLEDGSDRLAGRAPGEASKYASKRRAEDVDSRKKETRRKNAQR